MLKTNGGSLLGGRLVSHVEGKAKGFIASANSSGYFLGLAVGNMNNWQKKSPLDWETYVNKLVKVAAIEKHEYEGWVLTVDPISAR